MVITLQALAEAHIPTILEACADWPELAQYGPPYWRPRSSAELRRKIADTAGPKPATAYSFILADSDGRLVGEASLGLFRSLGFVEEGRLTQRYLVGGQYVDMLVLARITGV